MLITFPILSITVSCFCPDAIGQQKTFFGTALTFCAKSLLKKYLLTVRSGDILLFLARLSSSTFGVAEEVEISNILANEDCM